MSRARQAWFAVAPFMLALTTAAAAQTDAALLSQTQARFASRLASGQYMKRECMPVTPANWTGVDSVRCRYTEGGAAAVVTLLLPDAIRLARWTVTACRDASASSMVDCARHIEARIWRASNAQFAISGFVIEPRSVLGGSSQEPYCFLFRDGVTIRTATVTSRAPVGGICGPPGAESDAATRAFTYARIASTTREELAKAPGAPALRDLQGLAFLDAVRTETIEAWGSERNRLISGAAIADKERGKFN